MARGRSTPTSAIIVTVQERYGVVWAWQGGPTAVGELVLGPAYVTIEGRSRSDARAWVAAEQMSSVRGGDEGERLRDLPTLVVQAGQEALFVAPFEAERLSQLGEELHRFSMLGRPAAPLRLLVAGGGVAGLETALAVHEFARERVATTLLSADPHFIYRPLAVTEPFGGRAPRISLEEVARDVGATFELGALAGVDPDTRLASTTSGRDLRYDLLVVALGAKERPALDGAFTFGPGAAAGFADLLGEVDSGRIRRLVFVVPKGVVWAMPVYELALLTARRAAGAANVEITVVTSERAPLGLLGSRASRAVGDLLAERGVRVLANRVAMRAEPGFVVLSPDERVEADRVVALPRLEGPYLPGLPHDAAGYFPTDRFGHVGRLSTILAAGDATTFPIKQGGIAAQQAEVVARVVAARAGAAIVPAPFDPLVEAQLVTGGGPLYFRSKIDVGVGETSLVSSEPLSEGQGKIAASRLSKYFSPLPAEH
jgi:sulfide:quinone oxidoreductase